MRIDDVLLQRRTTLEEVIKASVGANRHLDAFAKRLLAGSVELDDRDQLSMTESIGTDNILYSGFPELAYLGFELGSSSNPTGNVLSQFLLGVQRLVERPSNSLQLLRADDIALLGIADGVAFARNSGNDVELISGWLLNLIEQLPGAKEWSFRARLLAGELIDPTGRMRLTLSAENFDEMALELALRYAWPGRFDHNQSLDHNTLAALLKSLLTSSPPIVGDLDRAAVWYRAIDVLIDQACQALTPSVSDTVRILNNVQGALKRWTWKATARRRGATPSRWLIDDEADVQALLWAILYPIYGAELVDETYLPSWGFVQPRVDLGIQKLKLIIEAKIAREPGDFAKFEGQIGEDIGLYFKDTALYDRLVVFVYDDCDRPEPENHDGFRNALLSRGAGRIEDVVIVRRPSMIPNRNSRSQIDRQEISQ